MFVRKSNVCAVKQTTTEGFFCAFFLHSWLGNKDIDVEISSIIIRSVSGSSRQRAQQGRRQCFEKSHRLGWKLSEVSETSAGTHCHHVHEGRVGDKINFLLLLSKLLGKCTPAAAFKSFTVSCLSCPSRYCRWAAQRSTVLRQRTPLNINNISVLIGHNSDTVTVGIQLCERLWMKDHLNLGPRKSVMCQQVSGFQNHLEIFVFVDNWRLDDGWQLATVVVGSNRQSVRICTSHDQEVRQIPRQFRFVTGNLRFENAEEKCISSKLQLFCWQRENEVLFGWSESTEEA